MRCRDCRASVDVNMLSCADVIDDVRLDQGPINFHLG